jgi:hypothetical protein
VNKTLTTSLKIFGIAGGIKNAEVQRTRVVTMCTPSGTSPFKSCFILVVLVYAFLVFNEMVIFDFNAT